MDNKQAAVIIPIYKINLTSDECISIERCKKILGEKYDIIWLAPESLNTKELEDKFGITRIERFDELYFQSISSYNKLMLLPDFYKRFLPYEYILIYQTDAYVFKDELDFWCKTGYDYIGAPWIKKQKYNKANYKLYIFIRKWLAKYFPIQNPYRLINLVGNGGFSLRKVESHYRVSASESPLLKKYVANSQKEIYNEDIFWAIEAQKIYKNFSIPGYIEALKFAFDKSPADAYRANNQTLPFGCHGWQKKKMINFWTNKILINNNNY